LFELSRLQYLYLDKEKFSTKKQKEIKDKLDGKFVYFK
jgi:hypothetical protein